ncbi:unnamed protein product, partial [Prorocentrum cordatum]
ALERWAGHYPELQPLASLPKALDALEAGVRRLGDPAEAPDPGEVRAGVGMEVAELQELLASLRPSAERLRTQLAKGPLSSLTALNLQLQSELQRGPGLPGGQALCEGLREVLDGAGCSAAPALDDALEKRAQHDDGQHDDELRSDEPHDGGHFHTTSVRSTAVVSMTGNNTMTTSTFDNERVSLAARSPDSTVTASSMNWPLQQRRDDAEPPDHADQQLQGSDHHHEFDVRSFLVQQHNVERQRDSHIHEWDWQCCEAGIGAAFMEKLVDGTTSAVPEHAAHDAMLLGGGGADAGQRDSAEHGGLQHYSAGLPAGQAASSTRPQQRRAAPWRAGALPRARGSSVRCGFLPYDLGRLDGHPPHDLWQHGLGLQF